MEQKKVDDEPVAGDVELDLAADERYPGPNSARVCSSRSTRSCSSARSEDRFDQTVEVEHVRVAHELADLVGCCRHWSSKLLGADPTRSCSPVVM